MRLKSSSKVASLVLRMGANACAVASLSTTYAGWLLMPTRVLDKKAMILYVVTSSAITEP